MNTLKDDRSFIGVFFLSLITFGIYVFYFIHVQAIDTNVACAEDGKKTGGLFKLIFLSIITFGIYFIVWDIKLVLRWQNYAEKNNQKPKCSILTHIILTFILSFSCVAPIIDSYLRLRAFNQACEIYNLNGGKTLNTKDPYSVENLWGWKDSQSTKQENSKKKDK